MADLSCDGGFRLGPGPHQIREWVLDNSAAQTVYKRQPLIIDASVDTVYLRGYVDAIVLVTGTDIFVGICASAETAVQTTDTETDNEVDVIMSGLVGFPTSSLTNADVGKAITMADSATVGTDAHAAGYLYIGRLAYVEDGYAYVEINALNGGAPTICYF
jgi:SpoU rRNA methylase family enzyme